MRPVSKKREKLNRERRKLVEPFFAENQPCEARFHGCGGLAVDPHEIKTRARGGSIVDLGNIAFLCRYCHDLITGESNWSVRHGWVVSSWATADEEHTAWVIRMRHHCDLSCDVDHRIDG